MAPPDLNSLPPSRSPSMRSTQISISTSQDSNRPQNQTPSPLSRSPSASLTSTTATHTSTTATGGTGSPRLRGSPRMERRRSSMLMSWNLDDGNRASSVAADPNHQRVPSLGELHQELENEQEAQVNRLLAMIRQQQAQLQQLQQAQTPGPSSGSAIATPSNSVMAAGADDAVSSQPDSTPSLSRPSSTFNPPAYAPASTQPTSQPTSTAGVPSSLSRHSSQGGSQSRSRRSSGLVATPSSLASIPHRASSSSASQQTHQQQGADGMDLAPQDHQPRDEVAFYKAETAMVQRENEMLKERIRELERRLADTSVGGGGDAAAGGDDDDADGVRGGPVRAG